MSNYPEETKTTAVVKELADLYDVGIRLSTIGYEASLHSHDPRVVPPPPTDAIPPDQNTRALYQQIRQKCERQIAALSPEVRRRLGFDDD